MTEAGDMWTRLGSTMASIMFIYAMFQQYFPHNLQAYFEKYTNRFVGFFNPYIQITIHEFSGERLKKSEAYTAIQAYLSSNSSKRARRLKADMGKDSKNLVLTMDDHEEISDEYKGIQLWWYSSKKTTQTQTFSFYPASDEKRYLMLKFHRRNRDIITGSYLDYVMEQGKAIGLQNRQRKLYTNIKNQDGYRKSLWSHVAFEHPAKFENLAMDPQKKKEIIDDLITFSKGKDYYAKVGKAWKRGYLLYGPPGTGKSTMIAAMANFMNYDIYDVELTAVKENSQLRKLLIETSNKSIIVIEDIDCSLDLTGQRKKRKDDDDEDDEKKSPIPKKDDEESGSKVTLSGLLNFIDGLWSACGNERLIVFTTNHIEKLDPALIRRGRMDKHIELSYCGFEGFKVLAKNYLDLDSHHLFETIRGLLEETKITPADVAEYLMPKTLGMDAETCLKKLIEILEDVKEEARMKAATNAMEKETKVDDSTQLPKEDETSKDVEVPHPQGCEQTERANTD